MAIGIDHGMWVDGQWATRKKVSAAPAGGRGAAVATADFTVGADANLGAPNWTQQNSGWGNVRDISASGKIYGTIASKYNTAVARWIGPGTFTDDQWAKITVSGWVFGSNQTMGVLCRAGAGTDSTRTHYFFRVLFDQGSNNVTLELGKQLTGGGDPTIINSATHAFSAGDTISLEVTGQSPNIQLKAFYNDVALGGSFTATGLSDFNTGLPGVMASGGNTAEALGDDWSAGNMT